MVSLDVGESFELPHHTLLCSATGKTQEITSKWRAHTRTRTPRTLHMQPIDWSDKQNKQLVLPPHNTQSVSAMTTRGPAAISSSSINYVFACQCLIGTSFHLRTPNRIPPECLMWVFIELLNQDKDKFSFLPSLKDSKVLQFYPWFTLIWVSLAVKLQATYVCCLLSFSSVYSCVQYTHACAGMRVTLAHNSNGRQEPCMHHKSLLSLVSSISSKQGHYGGQAPHLCLCATRSRVESWSQMVES